MGLLIEQLDYEHYLKLSIPLHTNKPDLVFHLRKLADELEKKPTLTSDRIDNIGITINTAFNYPSLELTLIKNIPFDRNDYMRFVDIDDLFAHRKSQMTEEE